MSQKETTFQGSGVTVGFSLRSRSGAGSNFHVPHARRCCCCSTHMPHAQCKTTRPQCCPSQIKDTTATTADACARCGHEILGAGGPCLPRSVDPGEAQRLARPPPGRRLHQVQLGCKALRRRVQQRQRAQASLHSDTHACHLLMITACRNHGSEFHVSTAGWCPQNENV